MAESKGRERGAAVTLNIYVDEIDADFWFVVGHGMVEVESVSHKMIVVSGEREILELFLEGN